VNKEWVNKLLTKYSDQLVIQKVDTDFLSHRV